MQRILSFIVGIGISAVTISAHHSIAGAYDTNRHMTIEGVVSQFHFVNPHPFVTMEVKDSSGSTKQWRLEMDNRFELIQIGMTEETLKQGDRVVVTGSPSRSQSQGLYVSRLDRPVDGFRYEQIGSSPRIRSTR